MTNGFEPVVEPEYPSGQRGRTQDALRNTS